MADYIDRPDASDPDAAPVLEPLAGTTHAERVLALHTRMHELFPDPSSVEEVLPSLEKVTTFAAQWHAFMLHPGRAGVFAELTGSEWRQHFTDFVGYVGMHLAPLQTVLEMARNQYIDDPVTYPHWVAACADALAAQSVPAQEQPTVPLPYENETIAAYAAPKPNRKRNHARRNSK